MSNTIVGLTGGIGSGKSAAADRFAELGVTLADADIASRAVVKPGQPALQKLADHFGADILQPDGTLDRTRLRHLVFADPEQRRWLQQLLHPLISANLQEILSNAASSYAVLINPLLFESGQNAWCQRVLVIDVPETIQIERTMTRDNNTREQVENIMRAQWPREKRLAGADDVIVNDQDLTHLHQLVDALHRKYLNLSI